MLDVSDAELSRLVSRALRHEPWLFELELDGEGWVPIDMLISSIRGLGGPWGRLERDDLVRMIRSSRKQRHEISGDRIRARYGHSVPGRMARAKVVPPEKLFHGTSPDAWAKIAVNGLRPMGRQYVHLSGDAGAAREVGLRKSRTPVIVTILAGQAHAAGINFYAGNEHVWLADGIPAEFITVPEPSR